MRDRRHSLVTLFLDFVSRILHMLARVLRGTLRRVGGLVSALLDLVSSVINLGHGISFSSSSCAFCNAVYVDPLSRDPDVIPALRENPLGFRGVHSRHVSLSNGSSSRSRGLVP